MEFTEANEPPEPCDGNGECYTLARQLEWTQQQVLIWLGRWRDRLPAEAVSALQDVCGVPDGR